MADPQPPLNYEASAAPTHPQHSTSLPQEVVNCLNNARFLHLATCAPSPSSLPLPHVSLMNYTFLPSTPYHQYPLIIMTTNPLSLKTRNLHANSNVSLLVHDWVSHRPPTRADAHNRTREGSPPPAAARSSLANLLLNLNTSALSSISTTITGQAVFLDRGSEEEKWCKEAHLANNTFGEQAKEEESIFGSRVLAPPDVEENQNLEAGSCFIEGEDVRVIIVRVREGRIADWKGGVKDWVVSAEGEQMEQGARERQEGLVNGVSA